MSLHKKESPYAHWELLDAETGDRLRIVPDRGGLITEWRCNGREILYFDRQRFIQKGKSVRGGIPVLFPICGNLPRDCLQLEKGDFTLTQHGFARDSVWQIKPIEDRNSLLLSLSDNDVTRTAYPYCFLVEMIVRLKHNAIEFRIILQNLSEEEMPFSFGLHPYFNVIDLKKTKIEGLLPICLNHSTMKEVETYQELRLLSEGIDVMSGPSKTVTLIDLVTGNRLHLQQQEPMDLSVVWTDPPRSMVCLEPWTSPRESLISGQRMLLLKPGAIQKLNCSFVVD